MIIQIIRGTPVWVWGLLAVLLALGLSQSMPRRASARRVMVLPALMLALSVGGVVSSFGVVPLALVAWSAGLALPVTLAIMLGAERVAPAGARWLPDVARFELPGSWLPLALILALFCLKYGVGVTLALSPGLAADTVFEAVVAFAYGAFSGLFAARAIALRRLALRR